MNKFLLAVPAFSDFITSKLHFIALNFVSGSDYQMMQLIGFIIIVLGNLIYNGFILIENK
jgi:hypothetical protein